MKRPDKETKTAPVGLRLSELAALLETLPRLTPEEAEAFAADIDEARRQMAQAELPSEPPLSPIDDSSEDRYGSEPN